MRSRVTFFSCSEPLSRVSTLLLCSLELKRLAVCLQESSHGRGCIFLGRNVSDRLSSSREELPVSKYESLPKGNSRRFETSHGVIPCLMS